MTLVTWGADIGSTSSNLEYFLLPFASASSLVTQSNQAIPWTNNSYYQAGISIGFAECVEFERVLISIGASSSSPIVSFTVRIYRLKNGNRDCKWSQKLVFSGNTQTCCNDLDLRIKPGQQLLVSVVPNSSLINSTIDYWMNVTLQ